MKKLRSLFDAHAYRQGFTSLAVAMMLGLFGFTSIGYALVSRTYPPIPEAGSGNHREVKPQADVQLPASDPKGIRIPDIQVSSPLIFTGLNPDGSPAVPKGDDVDKASWLTTSVSPGVKGTAIILWHVDSIKSGPSVFFNLGKLKPGQKIYVDRSDGKTAVYTVAAVEAFDRDKFPSEAVYGRADYAALNLITCGGQWDAARQEYSQNIVVFAALTCSE